MIAIPMENCHDLTLELESVQRAILYHCPLLINACIVPVVMRMPLLYIDTRQTSTALSPDPSTFNPFQSTQQQRNQIPINDDIGNENDLLTSRDPITQTIHKIVQEVVQDMILCPVAVNNKDDDSNNSEEEEKYGLNADNIKPILMNFKGLEIDGDKNEILHAIATEGQGTTKLRNFIEELRKRLHAQGWKTTLPRDDPQGGIPEQGECQPKSDYWRPRLPFMRLPPDFEEKLPPTNKPNNGFYDNDNDGNSIFSTEIRLPEDGGNGISPIFWYKWVDDVLHKSRGGVRLRELAVYGRTGPFGVSELAFYVPHLRTKLPDGNSLLQKQEDSDETYEINRRFEQEKSFYNNDNPPNSGNNSFDNPYSVDEDLRNTKSKADRRILETIYESSPEEDDDVTNLVDQFMTEQKNDFLANDDGVIIVDDKTDVTEIPKNQKSQSSYNNIEFVSDDEDIQKLLDIRNKNMRKSYTNNSMDSNEITDTTIHLSDASNRDQEEDAPTNQETKKGKIKPENKDELLVNDMKDSAIDDSDSISLSNDKFNDIIGSISKPIATGDWSKLKNKNKPKPEDNPILNNWRKRRTLAADSPSLLQQQSAESCSRPSKKLPPFPSDEYFVGIWKMVSTPRGPSIDQRRLMEGEAMILDASVSENIILRVDGTIAGGPILDFENQHRASGGTWRFFQAEWAGSKDTLDGVTAASPLQTRLRIRLVVPPEKKRILVMEGEVRRGVTAAPSTTKSVSEDNMKELLASSSFNIPEVEAVKRNMMGNDKNNNVDELFLSCAGEVWVEDARTGDNRVKLGRFSLLKADYKEPSQLRYTIPSPKRYQD